MAVRVYNNMSRRGTLGVNEFRFSVRMYMSLQYATNEMVLHVGTPAMRVMNNNIDEFAALRITKSKPAAKSSAQPLGKGKKATKRHSGCYLCPSTTHQAWDLKFHPRNPDGSRKKVQADVKEKILQRIKGSDATDAEKATERAEVERYWAQYAL